MSLCPHGNHEWIAATSATTGCCDGERREAVWRAIIDLKTFLPGLTPPQAATSDDADHTTASQLLDVKMPDGRQAINRGNGDGWGAARALIAAIRGGAVSIPGVVAAKHAAFTEDMRRVTAERDAARAELERERTQNIYMSNEVLKSREVSGAARAERDAAVQSLQADKNHNIEIAEKVMAERDALAATMHQIRDALLIGEEEGIPSAIMALKMKHDGTCNRLERDLAAARADATRLAEALRECLPLMIGGPGNAYLLNRCAEVLAAYKA